ncbi:MAG: hypothetical protein HYU84_09495 [Chloroflexi bacterium]|nr:hypothetical protein [Chloroflexota bacterium]
MSELKSWLSLYISGKEASQKTANVLARLWLRATPEISIFKKYAVSLAPELRKDELMYLHWGMSLLVFPLFHEVCTQVGRLLFLQSSVSRREIQIRMAEKYSNQSTIPRSVNRILQTLVAWGLLQEISPRELSAKRQAPSNILIKAWLIECAVFSAPSKKVSLHGLYKNPILFPFEFHEDLSWIVNKSDKLFLERDGNNLEYVVWLDM